MTAPSSSHDHHDARAAEMLADLKRAGLKLTAPRVALIRLFAGDTSHPTAQELYERLRPSLPGLSFATVYNTLEVLAEAGLTGTLRLGSAARFDPNTTPHHHAVCEGCGHVSDIPARAIRQGGVAARAVETSIPGFAVRTMERLYRGLCAACQSKRPTGKSPTQSSH